MNWTFDMDDLLTNRIFDELDSQSNRLEGVAKVSYENAATLSIVVKVIICLFIFIFTISMTLMVTKVPDSFSNNNPQQYTKEMTKLVTPKIKGGK